MRVLERGRCFNLLHESLGAEHRGEFGLEQLQGDLAVMLHIVAQIDGRHPAFAKLALDAVAAGERAVQAINL
ncbi:MAG: hypothetical protein NTU67_03655 [Gemmatimonadetes bacterium]|nr:hypothetical protein [Gemmatimonadota bacterium]